mgnify:CR=1 FL=1
MGLLDSILGSALGGGQAAGGGGNAALLNLVLGMLTQGSGASGASRWRYAKVTPPRSGSTRSLASSRSPGAAATTRTMGKTQS